MNELTWMQIADVLSKGFLAVHHGKKVPIDVIEEVQKLVETAITKAREEGYEEGFMNGAEQGFTKEEPKLLTQDKK